MSALVYDTNGDAIYLATYHGVVVDNADPQTIGRVRVRVPGLIEPASGWAHPRGGAGSSGARGLGGYDVPPVGASVVVSFLAGNIDAPQYEGAWHGLDEKHSVVPADPKNADKVKVFESARFLIVLNGVGGSEELLVKDKSTGDLISMTPSKLQVKSSSQVEIDAPSVSVGGPAALPAPNNAYRVAEAALFAAIAALATTAAGASIDPAGVTFYGALATALSTFESAAASYLTTNAKTL